VLKTTVLCLAPLIPAGMEPFHWNPQEWHRNPQEWHRNLLEWLHSCRNPQELTKIYFGDKGLIKTHSSRMLKHLYLNIYNSNVLNNYIQVIHVILIV
jgi:hypothetical protein